MIEKYMHLWCSDGHLNMNQSLFISDLVKKKMPNYCLETGFATGRSAITVLSSNLNITKFVTVDINFNYLSAGKEYLEKISKEFNNFYYYEMSSKNLFNDDFFKKEFPYGIDWFTVDGDHSYDGCMNDLKVVFPYMNKNSIIIIDDYKSGPPDGAVIEEVTNACNDFILEYSSQIIKSEWENNGKGMCIIEKI